MLDVQCDMYTGGHLVASDIKVWLHVRESSSHEGMFHVPSNLEILTGARYHFELLGKRAKSFHFADGHHSIDLVITEVSGQIAHFAPLPTSPHAHETPARGHVLNRG